MSKENKTKNTKPMTNLEKKIHEIHYKFVLFGIKNRFVLIKVFKNLRKEKVMKLFKYNKSLQEDVNYNINTYKTYAEKFSTIKLEIIPLSPETTESKIEFLKLEGDLKKHQRFFHIYFNDDIKETKRYYLTKDDDVKKIRVEIDYPVKSLLGLFNGCLFIDVITFKQFSRNNITNMSEMFRGCYNLKEINFSSFNTENVTNMSYMFTQCFNLKELNLTKFKTRNCTDMKGMFYFCIMLEKIIFDDFNTDNVTDMSYMFSQCQKLKELKLSTCFTDEVQDMREMFRGCRSLKELYIPYFHTRKVIDMNGMLRDVPKDIQMKIKTNYNNITSEAYDHDINDLFRKDSDY